MMSCACGRTDMLELLHLAVLCCDVRRCYLVQRQRAEQLGRSVPGFTRWVEDRRELSHLLGHANLNT